MLNQMGRSIIIVGEEDRTSSQHCPPTCSTRASIIRVLSMMFNSFMIIIIILIIYNNNNNNKINNSNNNDVYTSIMIIYLFISIFTN